jgi:phosphotriesterase-related protein
LIAAVRETPGKEYAVMNRRDFIKTVGAACVGTAGGLASTAETPESDGKVMTVLGPISPAELGVTLPHEHVLVDFVGADKIKENQYDEEEAFEVILPFLEQVRNLGCRSLVECTPAYIGRVPKLLKRLSAKTGMHLLTNTGYYGAANDKFVPAHAYKESADDLAARWLREWQRGIGDSGIRPGFIKIGVDAGALSPIDRQLVQAAARAHLRSGLTIASHTGDGTAAEEELKVLEEEGVDPSGFIWVHAQNGWDAESRAKAAKRGTWIEIDNIGPGSAKQCADMVEEMKTRGELDRVLVSHDAGWYSPGEPRGGSFRSFETLFSRFVPALKERGFSESDLKQILVENPRDAFTVRPRRRK